MNTVTQPQNNLDRLDSHQHERYREAMSTSWQLQAAKQQFSEVVRAAEAGEPQIITKHGKPVAVVIDIDDYRRHHEQKPSLARFLLESSKRLAFEGEFELPPRLPEPDRHPDLFLGDEYDEPTDAR